MRSSTVSFKGCEQVLRAYQSQGVEQWAILNGKVVMFATETDWDGTDCYNFLSKVLNDLKEGGSEAQFVLAVYKLKKTDHEINCALPPYRGFTFTLFGEEDRPYQVRKNNYMSEVDTRLDRMETMMLEFMKAQTEEPQEQEEKPLSAIDKFAGYLNGLLEMPDVKNRVALAAVGMLDKIIPLKMNNMRQPAQIAGTPQQQQEAAQQQQKKIQQAVNLIFPVDPLLGDHLLKVADIAVNNPTKYKMFIGML